MRKVTVELDIDLSQEGKHVGYARIPHSVDRSAYGWLPVPIISIRNGVGKTALLMAGVHGDEYEGQIALTRLAQNICLDSIAGQLIILPMANYPAAKSGTRVSPIDGGNLNRIFPGKNDGTITEVIANYIESELFSRADVAIDLHSGGTSLNYLPSTVSLAGDDPELLSRSQTLMSVFGAPFGLIFTGRGDTGSSYDAGVRKKVIRVGTELGGRAWVNAELRQLAEDGVLRILADHDIYRGLKVPPAPTVQFLRVEKDCFVYAPASGLFEASVKLGDHVKAGQVAGHIYFPEMPNQKAQPIHFRADGIVVCERAIAACSVGDCLVHIGKDM
jgi:predicted deacylase